jgi:hypothetical protein
VTAVYPASLPVKEAAGALLSSNPHSQLHDDMYDEIVAIATELGVNVSGSAATVAKRIEPWFSSWQTDGRTTETFWTQSATISYTNNYSAWRRIGNMVWWQFKITATSAGTSGSTIRIYLPNSLAAGGGNGTILAGGVAHIWRSTFAWTAYPYASSGNTYIQFSAFSVNTGGLLGSVPTMAVASGDYMIGDVFFTTSTAP